MKMDEKKYFFSLKMDEKSVSQVTFWVQKSPLWKENGLLIVGGCFVEGLALLKVEHFFDIVLIFVVELLGYACN